MTTFVQPYFSNETEEAASELFMIQRGLAYGKSLGSMFVQRFPDGVDNPQSCVDFADECITRTVAQLETGFLEECVPPSNLCNAWRTAAWKGYSTAIREYSDALKQ